MTDIKGEEEVSFVEDKRHKTRGGRRGRMIRWAAAKNAVTKTKNNRVANVKEEQTKEKGAVELKREEITKIEELANNAVKQKLRIFRTF